MQPMRSAVENRPLLCFTAAFTLGTAAGFPSIAFLLALPLFLRSSRASLVFLLLLGGLLGAARSLPSPRPELPEGTITLEGTVADVPRRFHPDRTPWIPDAGPPSRIAFTCQATFGKFLVYRMSDLPGLQRGDRIIIDGTCSPFREPSNFGEPDRASPLYRHGYAGRFLSRKGEPCTTRPGFHWMRPVDAIRIALRERMHGATDRESAGFLCALLLGFRDGLPSDLARNLQRSGSAHFLAISGLHLGLVFFLFSALFSLSGLPLRRRTMLLLVVCTAYTLLTGLSVAVLRAWIMIVVFLAGRLWRRPRDPLTSLGLAAFLILAFDPAAVHDLSFRLSFVAVLAIVTIVPVLTRSLGGFDARRTIPSVSLAAWLGTAPLIQGTFHIVTPLVVFTNLLYWPLVGLLILLGLFFLPFAFTPLGPLLLKPVSLLVTAVSALGSGLSSLAPLSHFFSPAPAPWLVGLYFTALAIWVFWCRGGNPIKRVWGCVPIAALLSLPLIPSQPPDRFFVAQLDVGRGLCTYVSLPGGRNFVFDAGSLDRRDPGKSVLAPYLWSRGVRRIDTVFVSHGHADHLNGLHSLVERFNVRQVAAPPKTPLPPLPEGVAIRRICRDGPAPREIAPDLEVLWPPSRPPHGKTLSTNDTSLVMRVGDRLLLTGDMMVEATDFLCHRPEEIRCKVLAAPHHGRRHPGSEIFQKLTEAALLIVSAPEGYASERLLEAFPGQVLTTGREGCIEVFLEESVETRTFRHPR